MTRIHPLTEVNSDTVTAAADSPKENRKPESKFQGVTFTPPEFDDEDEDAPKQSFDPGWGEKIINYILCRRDLATRKLEARPVSLLELFRYANAFDWFLLFFGTASAVCSGISIPALAILAGRLSNILIVYPPHSTDFRDKGYQTVYIILGIGGFALFINFFQYFCFQTCANRIITRLKYHYMESIIRQNAGWFDKNHSGAIIGTLNDNVERIREAIGEKFGLLLRGFIMLCAATVVSFIYEWRLTLLMLGIAPAVTVVMSILSQMIGSITGKELTDVGKAGGIAEESILGVRTVQSCNGQEEMIARYADQLKNSKKFAIQKGYWGGFLGGLFFFILWTFFGCGILYGVYLLKVGIFQNPGDVFTCCLAMLLGAFFLGLASPHVMVLSNARVAAAVIYKTIDRIPKIDVYGQHGHKDLKPKGRIEFKNVHFRYPTRKNAKVLNGLTLTIEPGQTVALVGHSGCGKSTTVGLLTRLYEPESGSVSIDGVEVRQYNIAHLRHVCGIVQQEPVLFTGTIAENLKIGYPECTREQMIRVCKMANAHDFIENLPQKYDTAVGDGGVQLSGGQKQRIAIARTLARDPKILLLDEATSALDAQSESIVQDALDKAAKGRSTITIAHRLSTIRNADVICVFEKGEIVEKGNHNELVALGGRYFDFVKAQQFTPSQDLEEVDLGDSPKESRVSKYDFPPENDGAKTSNFDDISSRKTSTRSSFGKRAFVRGAVLNDSISRKSENSIAFVKPLSAVPALTEREHNNYNIWTIYRNAHGQYLNLFFGFILAMIKGVEIPAVALGFGYIFKTFTYGPTDPGKMMNMAVRNLGIFIGIGAASWLLQFVSNIFFSHASEEIALKLRIRAFRNILYQDAGYFDNPANTAGKLITRLAGEVPNCKAPVDARMLQVIQGITTVVVSVIIAFVYSWQLALLGILYLSFLISTALFLVFKVMTTNQKLAESDQAGRISIEIIENVRTIQLLTREAHFNELYTSATKNQKKIELSKCFYESINNMVFQSNQFFMISVCYALGIRLIFHGSKDASDTFQAILALLWGAFSVMNTATFFPDFVRANSSSKVLFPMIFRKSTTGDSRVGDTEEIRGNILFEKVQFIYPQKPNNPVMVDLNFTALRGQTIALVGPSGCGKSTTISMLERFYEVAGGAIRIDGKDIRKFSLDHLRTQMALVGQEPRLFAGTIRDNVKFGLKTQVTEDQINKALDLANARKFINNLPAGIDTDVGEKGSQMSGGQKQRIAIARALIRDPKILLLDEATSALDSESERAVQEALDNARKGRTVLTIAHRLSSIQNSDVILYIEGGRVQEYGNHNQLMQKRAKYYNLIKKQDLET